MIRDFVAALVLFALDFGRFDLQRRDEGLQPGQARALVIEREGQELVENIADLGAEAARGTAAVRRGCPERRASGTPTRVSATVMRNSSSLSDRSRGTARLPSAANL